MSRASKKVGEVSGICPHCVGSDLGPGFLPSDWPCICSREDRKPKMIVPIVGIAGPASSGKDSFADALVAQFKFKKMAFADPLREMAMAIDPIIAIDDDWIEEDGHETRAALPIRYSEALAEYGYNAAKFKYPEIRQFLQRLGTDAVRNILGDSTWTDLAMLRAYDALGLPPNGVGSRHGAVCSGVAISDVRFKNEALAIKSAGGIVVKMQRPGVEPLGDHISEHDLDGWAFDYVIENDEDLDDLEDRAIWLYHNMVAVAPMEGAV